MKELHKILSQRHIQDTGRDLWQSCYDSNTLDKLPSLVGNEIAKEVSVLLWPDDDIPECLDELDADAVSIIEALVEECLDVNELSQEAADNTEYAHEMTEAARGEY